MRLQAGPRRKTLVRDDPWLCRSPADPGQEEVCFVISGIVTFKIDDDVFEAGPRTAVRVGGDAFRSGNTDTDDETELLIFSRRLDEPPTAQGRATRVTPSRRRAGVDTGIDR
jgi:hypothetical protein